MDEIFKIIEEQPKGEQFNILLELLQEKGNALDSNRLQSFYRSLPKELAIKRIQTDWLNCELIKQKLRQLYNENIPNELPLQNIAQP